MGTTSIILCARMGTGQPAKPQRLREDPWGPSAVRCPPLSVNSEDHLFTSWCFLQPSLKLCLKQTRGLREEHPSLTTVTRRTDLD